MSAMPAVVEEYWMARYIRGLQSGRHLTSVERIAFLVRISRYNHGRGICCPSAHLVIRGIIEQGSKILAIPGRPKLVLPDKRVVEEVIAQHVEHGHHADHCPKQIRPL